MPKKPDARNGQVLAGAIMLLLVLLIVVPAVVVWVQNETRMAVKDTRTTTAFNLAEAAVDRGMWKLKSTTSTWAQALAGTTVPGYDFGTTYNDVAGGTYRVRFEVVSATANLVRVYGEGRDIQRKETRALSVVYSNASLPGPLLTSGAVNYSGVIQTHWGPIMAQNSITLSGTALTGYFPRKLSKQFVLGNATYPRDVNGITPPNTDNIEWWSNYNVPDLPLLDFVTLMGSATANGTLNYYNGTATTHTLTGYSNGGASSFHGTCPTVGTYSNHSNHFYDSHHHPLSKNNLIWYWAGDVVFTGTNYDWTNTGTAASGGCHSLGLWGTIVVRGNMIIDTSDCYGGYLANVPSTAWQEYQRGTPAGAADSAAAAQYPADNGLRNVTATFNMGVSNWSGQAAVLTDVGFRGLIYVGSNLVMTTNSSAEIHGVVWVAGNISMASGVDTMIFYDPTLSVPVLNIILSRASWREVSPSTTTWN